MIQEKTEILSFLWQFYWATNSLSPLPLGGKIYVCPLKLGSVTSWPLEYESHDALSVSRSKKMEWFACRAGYCSRKIHGFIISKTLVIYCKKQFYFFRAVLGSQQNWGEGTEISRMPPVPTHAQSPPLSAAPPQMVHLLQLMNLHWHIRVTQSL